MESGKSLTPKKFLAARAVLTKRTLKEAALEAGVGYSTLRKWIKQDQAFQAVLAEAAKMAHEQMLTEVSQHFRLSK